MKILKINAFLLVFSFLIASPLFAGINELQQNLNKDKISGEKSAEVVIKNAVKKPQPKPKNNQIPQIDVKKLNDMKAKAAEKMKQYSFESLPLIEREVKVNGKAYKYKTFDPKIIKKSKAPGVKAESMKPKRISDPLRISDGRSVSTAKSRTDDVSEFPEGNGTSEDEVEAERILNELKEGIKNYNPTEEDPQTQQYMNIDLRLHTLCITYAKYPHICAMAKLYAVELYMKMIPKDNLMKNYRINNLCREILEYYSKIKHPMLENVIKIVYDRITQLNLRIGQLEMSEINEINQKILYVENHYCPRQYNLVKSIQYS